MAGLWAEHLEIAVELLRHELPTPDVIHSQDYLMSRGRNSGIGPKVMKQAAAKLGIVVERHVNPRTGLPRTYWRLPR